MIAKLLILICFSLYGIISIHEMIDIYKSYGMFINDTKCNYVYYSNLANCILGCLLSIYVVGFLLCKCMCKKIIEVKLSFSLGKSIIMFGFIALNIWNGVQLYNDDSCYEKYNLKEYSIIYICLVIVTLCILIIDLIFCSKKKDKKNYSSMNNS